MNADITRRWIGVIGAVTLAALLWAVLLTGVASAQDTPADGAWNTPGAMGYHMGSHMGYGPSASTAMTGTTGMMGGWGMMDDHSMATGMMGRYGMPMMTQMGGTMGAGDHPCAGWGMSGAVMPGATTTAPVELSVGADKALTLAQKYVEAYLPDAKIGDTATRLWGGYSVAIVRDGQQVGTLFVDGFTGEVWSHR
jgi:hypothetical protein